MSISNKLDILSLLKFVEEHSRLFPTNACEILSIFIFLGPATTADVTLRFALAQMQ